MSAGGRPALRRRYMRRVGVVAAGCAVLALLLLGSGHWVVGLLFAAAAVVAVIVLAQMRTVR